MSLRGIALIVGNSNIYDGNLHQNMGNFGSGVTRYKFITDYK